MPKVTCHNICDAIAAAPLPDGMHTKLIGIDGCGGSGKSTLARQLAQDIGARVIPTDDFAAWDCPLEWHDRFMAQVIGPFQANQPARYQRYDWHSRTLANWITVPAGGTVIIEGVSAIRQLFRPALAYKIYVETPRAIRLARGLARDGADAWPMWQGWMAEEDAYVAAELPAKQADLVIDGTQPLAAR
ncbi:AAA family ATPase [Yoonia sp. SS1-5]|uniref:Uridine kinase n=1 Tax=Yoonia rhodophyticola TaxID=3137370 RepID=A0AAN0NJY9_9RHOB